VRERTCIRRTDGRQIYCELNSKDMHLFPISLPSHCIYMIAEIQDLGARAYDTHKFSNPCLPISEESTKSTTCHQQLTITCMYAPCHHLLCGQLPVWLSNMLIECKTFVAFTRISGKTSLSPAKATGPRRSDNVIVFSLYLDADIQMHEYSITPCSFSFLKS